MKDTIQAEEQLSDSLASRLLARMARRASDGAGDRRRINGVAQFFDRWPRSLTAR
ncbi:MAG TPA: hypothetical protein VGX70_07815 [Gemmataceae bacterium]|jgi:hypothetical protein|nr:hypothetical protein [Gemmataceae bacterium]